MDALLWKRFKMSLPVILAMIVPGSGHVILGKPMRGLMMLMWMYALGYITFQLTSPDISFVGRFAGGFAVWVVSVMEVYRLSKRR